MVFYESTCVIEVVKVDKGTVVMTYRGEVTFKNGGYLCSTPEGKYFTVLEDTFSLLFKEI